MPHVKRVKLTLLVSRKAGEPARRAERIEPIGAPGHEFMHIALMPDVPDNPVTGRIENAVKREGQFYHPEIRREVPARRLDPYDQIRADLLGKLRHELIGQTPQILHRMDRGEQAQLGRVLVFLFLHTVAFGGCAEGALPVTFL